MTAIQDPLTPALSPRGEGAGCGPSPEEERNSDVLSPIGERAAVSSPSPLGERGDFGTHQPEPVSHLTGKRILIVLAACFGTVFAVNGFFVYKALSTAPGAENGASYETGLRYNSILAAERAQNALGWQHKISLDNGALRLSVQDAAGTPVTRLAIAAQIERPAGSSSARLAFEETGDGIYRAPLSASAGAWIVSISAKRSSQEKASESLYRAKERIWIPEVRP
jgi:nitrogen fixation protein FixH